MPIEDEIKKQRDHVDQLLELFKELSEPEKLELINQLKAKKENQRVVERKSFFNEVSYADEKGARKDFISDISETGLFIETHMPIEVGGKISLTFPVDAMDNHLKLSGEIVRKAHNGIGVKFHPLPKITQDKLHSLLDSLD